MHLTEYTAMTQTAGGGTEAVTVWATSQEAAREKLLRKGYAKVLWIL